MVEKWISVIYYRGPELRLVQFTWMIKETEVRASYNSSYVGARYLIENHSTQALGRTKFN